MIVRIFTVALLLCAARTAQADDCARLADATAKHFHTPNRRTDVLTMPGRPDISWKSVQVNGVIYMSPNGAAWQSKAFDADADEAIFRKGISVDKRTCEVTGTDVINGETADIITEHTAVLTTDIDYRDVRPPDLAPH